MCFFCFLDCVVGGKNFKVHLNCGDSNGTKNKTKKDSCIFPYKIILGYTE
jgi:hypothetical protein